MAVIRITGAGFALRTVRINPARAAPFTGGGAFFHQVCIFPASVGIAFFEMQSIIILLHYVASAFFVTAGSQRFIGETTGRAIVAVGEQPGVAQTLRCAFGGV